LKIALMADTHDNLRNLDAFTKLFLRRGVEAIIHAGDWCAPFTMVRLAKIGRPIYGVFGNVDGEREYMMVKASEVGVNLLGDFGEVSFNGVKIAVIHGVDERIITALAKSGIYNVVVRGHTHKYSVKRISNCIVVNPGEACGYLSGKASTAILDLDTLTVDPLFLN